MPIVEFEYTNHKGNTSIRRVDIQWLTYQKKPGFGYKPGWFIDGVDIDKKLYRSFALSNINFRAEDDSEYFAIKLPL